MPNGDIVIGGEFGMAGGIAARNVARWNGTVWQPLGTGIDTHVGADVRALLTLPNGDLIVGGDFGTAGGVAASRVARWDGQAWSPLGGGLGGVVSALARLPNGDIVAAGQFSTAGGLPAANIARGDGIAWYPLGSGLTGGANQVLALAVLPNGDLVAGGSFLTAGGAPASRVARWDGLAWSAIGSGFNPVGAVVVFALAALPGGGIAASGVGFGFGSSVARWDGTVWSPLGSIGGSGLSLCVRPNGDLIASGHPTIALNGARWDGTAWQQLGSGAPVGLIRAICATPDGDVVAFGSGVARWSPDCPATASIYASGCAWSGGTNTLTATTLPWVETTFVATGTSLPAPSIVLALTSVTAVAPGAVPLSLVFPQAAPGCDVLVWPDILDALLCTTGSVQSSLFLPNTPPLVGVTFYHQMVPLELGPSGDWASVTATNALQLTAGQL